MGRGYILLLVICIIAVLVITLNMVVIQNSNNTLLRNTCLLLCTFSLFRYFTLIVYGDSPDYHLLNGLRYFYFATSLGLTIPILTAIWHITPLYREKIKYPILLLLFSPWILFYLYIIIKQPTRIVVAKDFGYTLQLTGNFRWYLSIMQGSFIIIALILCFIGIAKYKDSLLRRRYFVLIVAQVALALDGLSYFLPLFNIFIFPQFTLTEVLGFLAVLYAFTFERRSKVKLRL